MKIDQPLVTRILERARASEYGLTEGLSYKQGQHSVAQYSALGDTGNPDLGALALLLVNAYDGKYDLVSVFKAALEIVEEECLKQKEVKLPKDYFSVLLCHFKDHTDVFQNGLPLGVIRGDNFEPKKTVLPDGTTKETPLPDEVCDALARAFGALYRGTAQYRAALLAMGVKTP